MARPSRPNPLLVVALLLAASLACNTLLPPTVTPFVAPTFPPPTLLPTLTPLPSALPLPTETLAGPTLTPWISPPPGRIVFVCFIEGFDNICLMNADGSDPQRLTATAATDFYPSLSPDGRTIVFSSRRTGNFEIYAMDVDGTFGVRQLTENLGSNFAPAFSPDGTQIVFVSTQSGAQNVWLMNADGTNPIRLTVSRGENIDPAWSPDGQQIVFASSRGGTNELYVMDVADALQGTDGSNVRQITQDMNIGGRSDWSPVGRTLTFYAGPVGARNIFTIDVEGTFGLRQLTDVGDNRGPTFSPDGQWIAFTSFRDGDNEIYIIRPDGTGLAQLTNNTRPDWQPRWGN